MTYQEAAKFLSLVKVAFPNSYKGIDSDTVEATVRMWHRAFNQVPYATMEKAFDKFILKSKFPPTVADIQEQIEHINSHSFDIDDFFNVAVRRGMEHLV